MEDYSSLAGGLLAAGLGIIAIVSLLVIAIVVYCIIVYVKLFKKCNKPGWAAIVPGYNYWVEKDIAGCHWLVFAGLLVYPVAGLIGLSDIAGLGLLLELVTLFAQFVINVNIAKKFGKNIGFAVGMTLLAPVFLSILVFNKNAVYNEGTEVKNCAFFNINF